MLVDLGLRSSSTPGFRPLLHLLLWIVPFCTRSPVQCHFFVVTLSLCSSCHLWKIFLWTLLIFLLLQCFWFLLHFRGTFPPLSSAAHCLLVLHLGHPSTMNGSSQASGKQCYSIKTETNMKQENSLYTLCHFVFWKSSHASSQHTSWCYTIFFKALNRPS